jgi:hypothetical protein
MVILQNYHSKGSFLAPRNEPPNIGIHSVSLAESTAQDGEVSKRVCLVAQEGTQVLG